jgi:hypothetical protein
VKTVYTLVSFVNTPITEVGTKANEILALGWRHEETLPDNWTVKFSRDFPEDVASATADDEIKQLMGAYWVEP